MMLLLTGGSKSGKSSLAEKLALRLAEGGSPLVYLATMRVFGQEEERIVARHQQKRAGKGFQVLERQLDLGGLELPRDAVLLLEDVPNLLANEMFGGAGPACALCGISSLRARCRHLVAVTNEVGADGAAYLPSTLAYINALGRLNQQMAMLSDSVAEVVCGLPLLLKGALP